MKHDTASYSNHPQRESANLINSFNVSSEHFLESDLKKIEFLLYQGEDSSFKDSSIQADLANLDDYFFDPILEMFTKEHAPDYSSPPKFDVYLDDFLENESNADNFYNDLFDYEGEKIKESKLLMDKLDLPYVPKSRMLLPFSTENKEQVFKPGIHTSGKDYSDGEDSQIVIHKSSHPQLRFGNPLTDYGFHFDKIPMYCDSKAAIAISCNPIKHSRTKHIDIGYHFIKEKVEKGIVELFIVGTEYQLADLFTKALPEERFKYLVRRLGMRCLTPEELEALENESA
uniref:Retrovirus-related Pol polyprotein from transposon TNT 1-94 n=1 Tax=Tanacetum cinerariifolium TaxID=118510 RepID=A0A6L2J290_TANCI|nr:retrovirus-related Pol polyprotein from transposon TNT 1-94 [Tanacetum cinerariifolium]